MKLDSIPVQVSLDQVPPEFIGTVTQETEGVTKQGGKKLSWAVTMSNGSKINLGWKVPKALTGKGQFDLLIKHLTELKIVDTKDAVGRTFRFKREALTGPMQGNPRHYPIEQIVKK